MVASNNSGNIQIKIKMPNLSQSSPASSKAQNEDLKDMDVLCTFKIKIGSKKLENGCTKNQYHIQIFIKLPKPSKEPQAPYIVPNEDLKNMDALCTVKFNLDSQYSNHFYINDQW